MKKFFWYQRLVDSKENKPYTCLYRSISEERLAEGVIIRRETPFHGYAFFEHSGTSTLINNLISCLAGLCEDGKTYFLHEVVPEFALQKPRFDLDCKGATPEEAQTLINGILTGILRVCQEKFNMDLNLTKDVRLCSSCGKTKISYHIIVSAISLQSCHEAQAFHDLVITDVEPELLKYVDPVNKRNQSFRILGSTKVADNEAREKVILHRYQYFDEEIFTYLGQYPENPVACGLYLLGETLLTYIPGTRIMPDILYVKPVKSFPTQPDLKEKWITKAIDCLAKKLKFESPSDPDFPFRFRSSTGRLIDLERIHPFHCERCDHVHDHENAYIRVEETGRIYFVCRRTTQKIPYQKAKIYIGTL